MGKQTETFSLIGSDKVEGTSVYNHEGEKLGTIDSLMIDKRKGSVAYAIMSFGGFLGIGEHFHPLPWEQLTYDDEKDGYIVSLTRKQLEDAPSIEKTETHRLTDPIFGTGVFGYYGLAPYWL